MRIESSNYLSALEALRNANTATTQSTTTSTQTKEMDAYIPSNSEDEILYANYNDILSSYLQAMQSSSSTTESTSSTSATQAVDSTIKSIVDNISNSLRCNKETVFSTLQNLGLTPEDL
jgi:glucosamine 6-phosphate synthetase-like amidotransferase/phosphosugar isomerase protein